jgi:hypothetical protein
MLHSDQVVVAAGTYRESLNTARTAAAHRVKAAGGAIVLVTYAGRLIDVQHAFTTVEGLILDGQFAASLLRLEWCRPLHLA